MRWIGAAQIFNGLAMLLDAYSRFAGSRHLDPVIAALVTVGILTLGVGFGRALREEQRLKRQLKAAGAVGAYKEALERAARKDVN